MSGSQTYRIVLTTKRGEGIPDIAADNFCFPHTRMEKNDSRHVVFYADIFKQQLVAALTPGLTG